MNHRVALLIHVKSYSDHPFIDGAVKIKRAKILKAKYIDSEGVYTVKVNLFKNKFTILWDKDYITSVSLGLMAPNKEEFENNLFDNRDDAELIYEIME